MRKCSCLNPAGGSDLCGSLGWFCMLKTKISYKWTSYESKICILILLLKSDKIQSDGFFFFNYRIGCMRAWNCLTVSATINGSQTLLLFYSWTRKIFLKKKSKEVLSLFATLNMQVLEGCADTEGVFCSTPNFWCTDREELYNSRASEIFIWPDRKSVV